MAIIDQCPVTAVDKCARQYIVFIFTLGAAGICLYSIIMVIKKRKQYRFEIFPLAVNGIATWLLCLTYLITGFDVIYLTMLFLQIISYSLLSYSYALLYLKGVKNAGDNTIRNINVAFLVFCIAIVSLLIGVLVYDSKTSLACSNTYSLWYAMISVIELLVSFCTTFFVCRSLRTIRERNKLSLGDTIRVMHQQDDRYITIRYRQAYLTLASLSISVLLHATVFVLLQYYATVLCRAELRVQARCWEEVLMLSFADSANLIPHFMLPLILYLIPLGLGKKNQSVTLDANSCGVSSKLISGCQDGEQFRDKLWGVNQK